MNMKIEYFDNLIDFTNNEINVLEIENKKYFYRFVNDLYSICNVGMAEDINFLENQEEKKMTNKVKVFIDYFDFKFDSKKYITEIAKYVNDMVDEESKYSLTVLYNKIIKIYNKILNNIDLPLTVENDISIESITKLININISSKKELLDNLMLLVDLERTLKTNCLLVFVNLKQYLNKAELIELYKYAIYNNINILLVDSQCYGVTLEYEKKIIIDESLDEFML